MGKKVEVEIKKEMKTSMGIFFIGTGGEGQEQRNFVQRYKTYVAVICTKCV